MKPQLRARSYENVTPWQRRDLINWCWGIYSKIANVRGAIHFKTDFACSDGCYVEYRGQDKTWGKRLESHLNETYYPNCNLAGENHDFHTTLAEVSIALETHGQVGWMFDNVKTGRIKLISASSIGNGMSPDSKSGAVYELGKADTSWSYWGLSAGTGAFTNSALIERGPFIGHYITDGIIHTRGMVVVGYRLLGFGEDGKASYADFSTQQMGLIYEPKFTDQIMGYPGLSGIVESVGTVDDWNYYIGQAMKLSAAFAVTRKSKDGNPQRGGRATLDPNEAGTAKADRQAVQAFEIVGAGLVELATDNNEEIGHVPFERPSMNEEAFIERVETGFFCDLWPRGFIYNNDSGRAASRMTVVQAKQIVWKRHRTLNRFGVQWLRLKTAHAMKNGEIPVNDNLFDPYMIRLSTPAEISVDEGNDAKIDLAKLGRGATSHQVMCAKDGLNWEQLDDENFHTLTTRMKKAKTIFDSDDNKDSDGDPILSIKEILQRIDNGGNPTQQIDLASEDTKEAADDKAAEAAQATPPTTPSAPEKKNSNK